MIARNQSTSTGLKCNCTHLITNLMKYHIIFNPSWPDFPTDMHDCAEDVFIKLTILVTPIKLYTKMFLIS